MSRTSRWFSWLNILTWGFSSAGMVITYILLASYLSIYTVREVAGLWTALGLGFGAGLFAIAWIIRRAVDRAGRAGEAVEFFTGMALTLNVALVLLVKFSTFVSFAPGLPLMIAYSLALDALLAWAVARRLRTGDFGPEGWSAPVFILPVVLGVPVVFIYSGICNFERVAMSTVAAGCAAALAAMAGTVICNILARRSWPTVAAATLFLGGLALTGTGMNAAHWLRERRALIGPDAPGIQKVILITIDTLRHDMVFRPEGSPPLAPNLLKFAGDSMNFGRASSPAPWTFPSFASMMSGLSPLVHNRGRHDRKLIPSAIHTLAEYFQENGRLSAAILYNLNLNPAFNLKQGFDEYVFADALRVESALNDIVGQDASGSPAFSFGLDDSAWITRLGVDWIKRHAGHRYFLWIHYLDPHQPYQPPRRFVNPEDIGERGLRFAPIAGEFHSPAFFDEPGKKEWAKMLHEAEVRYVDQCFGRILDSLRESGQYDDALIILSSDHGEEFWDHGLYEHGHSLYQELLHVPLVVKLPGGGGRAMDAPTATAQIMPTILDLCSFAHDPAELDYPSLRPLWEDGTTTAGQMTRMWSGEMLYGEEKQAYTEGGLKLIQEINAGTVELYDTVADPLEQHNLAAERPADVAEMIRRMQAHVAEKTAKRNALGFDKKGLQAELPPDVTKGLKDLGYM